MGELIAVLSGKGGTGKTSLCAALASALATMDQRVLCIDCDIGLRNLDISLGMSDSGAISFMDVIAGRYTLEQAATHGTFTRLSFLTAPVNCSAEQIPTREFSALLRQARQKFDYIFLDAPAGIDAGFQLCAANADRVIIVTGSDPASMRDARRAGELLELQGKQNVRLIVNRVRPKLFSELKLTVDDVMDQTGLPLLGIVPEDVAVIMAATYGKPLLAYTRKGAAAACSRIAKRIQGQSVRITDHL